MGAMRLKNSSGVKAMHDIVNSDLTLPAEPPYSWRDEEISRLLYEAEDLESAGEDMEAAYRRYLPDELMRGEVAT